MGQAERPTCPHCGEYLILALPPGGKGRRTFQCLDCERPDPLKTEQATGWLKGELQPPKWLPPDLTLGTLHGIVVIIIDPPRQLSATEGAARSRRLRNAWRSATPLVNGASQDVILKAFP
jgi:hypothetical protein